MVLTINKVKPVTETESILLKEITPDHKEDLFSLYSDPEMQNFIWEPVVVSMEEIEQSVKTV